MYQTIIMFQKMTKSRYPDSSYSWIFVFHLDIVCVHNISGTALSFIQKCFVAYLYKYKIANLWNTSSVWYCEFILRKNSQEFKDINIPFRILDYICVTYPTYMYLLVNITEHYFNSLYHISIFHIVYLYVFIERNT